MGLQELKKRIYELKFNLPKTIFFEEKKEGIRVSSKKLMSAKIKGIRGILAYKKELTQPFVLTFGKFSEKRVELSKEQVLRAAEGKKFAIDKEDGEYIAFYKGFPVCLVYIKEGVAIPVVEKGFKRKIKN